MRKVLDSRHLVHDKPVLQSDWLRVDSGFPLVVGEALHCGTGAVHLVVGGHRAGGRVAAAVMEDIDLRLLDVLEVSPHHGDVDPTGRNSLGNLGLTGVAAVGEIYPGILHVFVSLPLQHSRLPVIECHLHVQFLLPVAPGSDAGHSFLPCLDDGAGQVANAGLHVGPGVQVFSLDLHFGAPGPGPVPGLDVTDHGVNKFVVICRFSAEICNLDNNWSTSLLSCSRPVNLAHNF